MVVPPPTPILYLAGISMGNNTQGIGKSPLGEGVGVYSYVVTDTGVNIPSLSCSGKYDPVSNCNHNTGKVPITNLLQYCLLVQNPYSNAQKVGVTFSNTTVFGIDFTSPGNGDGQTGATIAMP